MNDCRGNLLDRVRQGSASTDDRLALDAHLSQCENCRLSWELGGAFDRVGVAKDDGATIARLTARTLEKANAGAAGALVLPLTNRASLGVMVPPGTLRLRRITWRPLLLAALVFSSVAMAGVLTWSVTGDGERKLHVKDTAQGVRLPDEPANRRTPTSKAAEPAPIPPLQEDEALAVDEPQPQEERPATRPIAPTAASLFKAANDARRAGHRAVAVTRYRDLQRRFPTSPEATLSQVSLGGLLLEQGSATSALEQFEMYLRTGSNKPLLAEALYGRGRALGALRQHQREIKNWQQLLSAYPDSPYSGAARRRLDTLRTD